MWKRFCNTDDVGGWCEGAADGSTFCGVEQRQRIEYKTVENGIKQN